MSLRTHLTDKINKETLLDELFLTLNIHKYDIKCASLTEDFSELSAISHISDSKKNKIKNLKNTIKQIKSINSISYS